MNSHDRQHESLDDDERELARIVRALPGGDPPPALDARILRMAQDAVAAAPTRRRHPLLAFGSAWGISSAAAAVLALGVGWQLLNAPGRGLPASDGATAPASAMKAQADSQRTEVDFIQRELPATPPPPPADIAALPKSVMPTMKPAPPASVPMAESVAAAEPFMDEHVPPMPPQASGMAAASAEREARKSLADDAGARQEMQVGALAAKSDAHARNLAPAAPVAAPAPAAGSVVGEPLAQDRGSTSDMDQVVVTGSRIGSDARIDHDVRTRAITSSIADRSRVQREGDDTLAREAWLERIRKRMRDDDLPGAHASLLLLLEKHPGTGGSLPADIRRLLQK